MKIRAERKGSHSAKSRQGSITGVSGSSEAAAETGAEGLKESEVISLRSLQRKGNLKLIIKIQRRFLTKNPEFLRILTEE